MRARGERFLASLPGRGAGPVTMSLAAVISVVWLRASVVLVGGALVALSQLAVQRRVEALQEARADAAGDRLAALLVHSISMLETLNPEKGGLFRASVWTMDGAWPAQIPTAGARLEMAAHSDAFSDDECGVGWAKGEGPIGRAWSLGRRVVCPELADPAFARRHRIQTMPFPCHEDGGPSVVTEAQARFLDPVEMQICYPIKETRRAGVVAVLAIDDTLPPGEHLEDVLRAGDFLCEEVRRFLHQANEA